MVYYHNAIYTGQNNNGKQQIPNKWMSPGTNSHRARRDNIKKNPFIFHFSGSKMRGAVNDKETV